VRWIFLLLWFSQIQMCLIQWGLRIFRQFPLTAVISALLASTLSVFRTRAGLQLVQGLQGQGGRPVGDENRSDSDPGKPPPPKNGR
jgi:hypothetical protein